MTDRLKVALVLLAAVAVGLGLARVARGQSIQPDVWAPSSGYSVGPGGVSSWDESGGYYQGSDGTTSSWSGPVVVPAPVPEWAPQPAPVWAAPLPADPLAWPQP